MNNRSQEKEEENSLSPILSTRYAYKAAKMIHLIEKNFLIVIGIAAGVFIFTIIDLLQEKGFLKLFPDDNVNDIIITTLAAISLAALVPAFWFLIKSRKALDNWAKVFEQNSIRAGVSIAMGNKTKEEAVRAVAEAVEQIGEPLRKYIASKQNFNEFFDVNIIEEANKKKGEKKCLTFDVLMNADQVLQTKKTTAKTTNDTITDDLKKIFREYGAIIIKIMDGAIDKGSVQSFSNALSEYTSISKENQVGLALLIGDGSTQDAKEFARSSTNKRIHNIILVEKPRNNNKQTNAFDIANKLKHAEDGSHYIVIYPDLMTLREIYSQYVKAAIEENNDVMVIISHYETIDNVRHILSEDNNDKKNKVATTIDVEKYEKDGSLVILDSIEDSFDLAHNSYIKNLLDRAKNMDKNGICILADNGSFFNLHGTEEMIKNEMLLPAKFDVKLKRMCMILRQDFDRLTEEQMQKLLRHHGKIL
jgi:hypothetical protein